MSGAVQAVLIPADENRPVSTLGLPAVAFELLARCRELVGGWVEAVAVPGAPDAVLWVNEDGKRLGLPRNDRATELAVDGLIAGDELCGDCVLLGIDADGGECDVPYQVRDGLL